MPFRDAYQNNPARLPSGLLLSQVLKIVKIMELSLQSLTMVAVGAMMLGGIVVMALKVMTTLQKFFLKLETTLENISWSCSACAEKLNFVERRMERLLQSGDESARHLCQVVVEYSGELAGRSLKWPLRQTLEVYQSWRAARM